jgi:hypothetical protein
MTTLVTGPAGFIESARVDKLLNRGDTAIGIDNHKGLMQVWVTPEMANPEGWLEGCSPCRNRIQWSSVGTLSKSQGIVREV